MDYLRQRGFHDQTIAQSKLGYSINPTSYSTRDFFRERAEWGLINEYKENGHAKKLWLPSGIVIPTMSNDGCITKLKIRRQEWSPKDPLPKYVEIAGSMTCPSVFGDPASKAIIILESELDAILIQQEAKDICCSIALGGSTKRPDFQTDRLLRNSSLILWSLDNDEAGRKAALWWRVTYPHLIFWPAPAGKSPGDALKDHNVNLRDWLSTGIECSTEAKMCLDNS